MKKKGSNPLENIDLSIKSLTICKYDLIVSAIVEQSTDNQDIWIRMPITKELIQDRKALESIILIEALIFLCEYLKIDFNQADIKKYQIKE